MTLQVKTKKWGNSIGIIIPSEAVERFNIKPEERLMIKIEGKENSLKELFGAIKFKKSTKKIIAEARKEMESKWAR
ncbi:MAG: hypothetical protein AABW79_04200 [Nanoarchaeota archaeon]